MKGSVIDLAVGIIIGTSFNKIVSSLVNNVLMPPFGLILGNINFGDKFVSLSGHYNSLTEAQNAGAPVIAYGMFVNAVIEFIIIALVMFLLIREINRLRRKPEAQKEPTEKNCPFCFTVIPIRAVRCPNCTSELGT